MDMNPAQTVQVLLYSPSARTAHPGSKGRMRILVAGLTWLLLSGMAFGQVGGTVAGIPQDQPRDPRAQATGTAVVSGRVLAGDSGLPLRRAQVTLSGTARPRSTYTDHEGRFTFTAVAPGSYTVSASPGTYRGGYQPLSYGASASMMPGKRVAVSDGQTVENLDIALPRAGTIAGRVTDSAGEAVARAQVTALLVRAGSEPQSRMSLSTDDLGQFRLFGLQPGTYLVRAEVRFFGGGPNEVEGEPSGFAPTYAPGTPNRADALVVRVLPGRDAAADIRLIDTRLFTIRGHIVSASGEPPAGANVSLVAGEPGAGFSSSGTSVGQDGSFTFRNVVPGSYEILAQVRQDRPAMSGPSGPPLVREMGSVRIDVSADLDNVMVPMRRGESVTG